MNEANQNISERIPEKVANAFSLLNKYEDILSPKQTENQKFQNIITRFNDKSLEEISTELEQDPKIQELMKPLIDEKIQDIEQIDQRLIQTPITSSTNAIKPQNNYTSSHIPSQQYFVMLMKCQLFVMKNTIMQSSIDITLKAASILRIDKLSEKICKIYKDMTQSQRRA